MAATIRYNTAKEIWQVKAGSLWFPLMHEEREEWGADGNAIRRGGQGRKIRKNLHCLLCHNYPRTEKPWFPPSDYKIPLIPCYNSNLSRNNAGCYQSTWSNWQD